jgi:hypothetical protein
VAIAVTPPAVNAQPTGSGDEITVEVNDGIRWHPLRGRVQKRLWPWVAAAAAVLVVAAGATAAALASQDESDDNVATDGTTVPPPADGTTAPQTTEGPTVPPPEPPIIESLSVDAGCTITVAWDATGNPDGTLELTRRIVSAGDTIDGGEGEVIRDSLPVESGSVVEDAGALVGEGVTYTATYELIAYDSEHQETDRESANDTSCCGTCVD